MFEGVLLSPTTPFLSRLDSAIAFDRPVIRGPVRLSLVSNMAMMTHSVRTRTPQSSLVGC
jgi:hypothetical protein